MPLSGDAPPPAKRQHLDSASKSETLQQRLKQAQVSLDDTSAAPSPSSFTQDIHQNLRKIWLYQRTASGEHVGQEIFGDLRRQQLKTISGGALAAAQYGLSFASDEIDENNPNQLHMQNRLDSEYHRTSNTPAFNEQCMQLYLARGGQEHEAVTFVNSSDNAKRLLSLMPPADIEGGSVDLHFQRHFAQLFSGIYALRYKSKTPEHAELIMRESESLLHYLGAKPSQFQAAQASVRHLTPMHYPPRLLTETLLALRDPRFNQAIAQLRALPAEHGAQVLTNTTASLLATLLPQLDQRLLFCRQHLGQKATQPPAVTPANAPLLPFNPELMHNSLKVLLTASETMPAVAHNSSAVADCYRVIIEEMHILLSTCKTYNGKHFKAAMNLQLASRLDKNCQAQLGAIPESFLLSSGMHAVSLGIELAQTLSRNPTLSMASTESKLVTPVYFEISELLDIKPGWQSDDKTTLYATLNHSTPQQNEDKSWGVTQVIASTKKTLAEKAPESPPLTLVLDSTIEKRHDLQQLTQALSDDIGSGKLRILLCKSYQKYANLGTAKAMAGGITLLAKPAPETQAANDWLKKAEDNLGWMNNPESQLLVHMLRAGEQEFAMLERAGDNARFVKEALFNGKEGNVNVTAWEPGLPFVMIGASNTSVNRFTFNQAPSDDLENNYYFTRRELINSDEIRDRNSFGFNTTSISFIPIGIDEHVDQVRIAFGMESKTELCERLYMPARLLVNKDSTFSCEKAKSEVEHLLEGSGLFTTTPGAGSLTLAQKIAQISSQQRSRIEADTGDSVSQMRQTTQVRQQHGDLLMSKLTSVIFQLSWMASQSMQKLGNDLAPAEKEIAEELVTAFVDSGMHGVSPHTRAYIVEFGAMIAIEDVTFGPQEKQKEALNRLLALSEKMGGMQGVRVNCLKKIDDDTFGELPAQLQRQIVDKLFMPLDNASRLQFIQNRVEQDSTNMANVCLDAQEEKLQSGSDILRSDTLNQGIPFPTLNVATPHDVNLMKEQLNRFRFLSER
ncbi:hypothetical protein ED28_06940 [[Pantoea] beijingensis]|uniref:Uncharacterized protein n=2 Tax=[Pantoea] beijingensis TaxID=1324864 RepID=A0A443IF71_9GAMM|nr:hypothetical protein ED28_06940 [[Pantoea] beijingensis]